MDTNEVILKPTGAVHIVNSFTLMERKLLNGIIWHAQRGDKLTTEECSMPLAEVFHVTGMDNTRNYQIIKDALKRLATCIIEWNALRADRKTEWGFCTFLSGGRISDGHLYYVLNSYLVNQINNPILYAKIQLLVQSRFKRRYALILYEFFIDALCRQQVDKLNMRISLDDLISVLGLRETHYAEVGGYKFLNRDVIKPGLREINERSDIKVECKPQRKQRRVAVLIFNIEAKEGAAALLGLKDDEIESNSDFGLEQIEKAIISKTEEGEIFAKGAKKNDITELAERLTSFGITKNKAFSLVKKYSRQQIENNLELALCAQSQGQKIRNFPAFLVRSIEDNYAGSHTRQVELFVDPLVNGIDNTTKQGSAKSREKDVEKEWRAFVSKRLNEKFDSQDSEWKDTRLDELLTKAKQEHNTILLAENRKSGLKSSILRGCLLSMVKQELLTEPEEQTFEAYLVWREQNSNPNTEGH